MQEVIKDRSGKKTGYVEKTNNSLRIKDERGKVNKIITSGNIDRRNKLGGY